MTNKNIQKAISGYSPNLVRCMNGIIGVIATKKSFQFHAYAYDYYVRYVILDRTNV